MVGIVESLVLQDGDVGACPKGFLDATADLASAVAADPPIVAAVVMPPEHTVLACQVRRQLRLHAVDANDTRGHGVLEAAVAQIKPVRIETFLAL